jgi:hypothetical protein
VNLRRNWPFFALVLLILAALPVGWFVFLAQPPQVVAPAVPVVVEEEPPRPVTIEVAELEGLVEVRQEDGSWLAIEMGQPLRSADAIRTAPGASAVLVGGGAWEVRMAAGTEISIDDLTASISRLMLQAGMATASVRGEGRHTFEVQAAGSDAVARTREGAFAMSNDGQGTVAVGTREGEVELAAGGKVVIVRAGQQSVVQPGGAPSDPTAIPSSLLLKVRWPDRKLLTRKRLVVAGQTDPGAHVSLGGQVLTADGEGRFSGTVRLSEGRNRLEVRATGVGGGAASSDVDLQVDTRGPGIGIDRNLWKQ